MLVQTKYVSHSHWNRGSYISVHGFFNLLNEFGKSDKMLSNKFKDFNDAWTRMLDSIYRKTHFFKNLVLA